MTFVVADRVKETTTTAGTGPLALAGAMTGFSTFASRCAVGDTLYYCIQETDAFGAPSGAWECGLGTYSAASTLTRTTVTSSSNSDAAVSFAAGTKQVYITMPAVQVKWPREKLTAARTYYVATTGSDSNDGLTVGTPFLTIQKAIDVVAFTLDMQGYQVTVQVANGTYTAGVVFKQTVGSLAPLLLGNAASPSSVVISTTSANCVGTPSTGQVARWQIQGFKLTTTTGGSAINAAFGSVVYYRDIDFGACATYHIYAQTGGHARALGSFTVSGGAQMHIVAIDSGLVSFATTTVTLSGTPVFANMFIYARVNSYVNIEGVTYSGSATGQKYLAVANAVIYNPSALTIPGSTAGSTASGGYMGG